MGLLVPYLESINISGDSSLSRRDFYRCIEPLEKFGCSFYPKGKTTLPLKMKRTDWLLPLNNYELKYPSAQVKTWSPNLLEATSYPHFLNAPSVNFIIFPL